MPSYDGMRARSLSFAISFGLHSIFSGKGDARVDKKTRSNFLFPLSTSFASVHARVHAHALC